MSTSVAGPFTHLDSSPSMSPWLVAADSKLLPKSSNGHAVSGTVRHYEEHEHLYLVGQKAHMLYQVCDGVIGVYTLLADGRRQITSFAYPGDVVGLGCAVWHYDSAQALCPATVRAYPINAIDRLLVEEPGFLQALLRGVSSELADTRERMVWLGQMSAAERVAGFLMQMAERHAITGTDGCRVWLPMMRGDIADYLGLKVETVSRQLTRLRVARIIKMHTLREIEILDTARLAEQAQRSSTRPSSDARSPDLDDWAMRNDTLAAA